ncbi:MAG: SDR family NAD(P)-dependent oxidoreductase [Acidimicrobiales bacterium]
MTPPLKNKSVLVTGAAQGIGRCIAQRMSDDGALVVMLDRDPTVIGEAEAVGSEHLGIVVDLCDSAAVKHEIQIAADKLGGLWGVVNNAGIFAKTPLLEMPIAEWDQMMKVNARSMLLVMQAAAPFMIAAGGGRIVNQSSMAAKLGTPGEAHYAASKAAVGALTRIAAQELGPHNITVNSICPGYVLTEMGAETRDPAQIAEWTAKSPLGRLGSPDDVANAVAFLMSDQASYITGEALNVSGGMCTW